MKASLDNNDDDNENIQNGKNNNPYTVIDEIKLCAMYDSAV